MTTIYFIHERKGVKYLLRVVQKMYRWRDTHKITAIGKTDLIHTQMPANSIKKLVSLSPMLPLRNSQKLSQRKSGKEKWKEPEPLVLMVPTVRILERVDWAVWLCFFTGWDFWYGQASRSLSDQSSRSYQQVSHHNYLIIGN